MKKILSKKNKEIFDKKGFLVFENFIKQSQILKLQKKAKDLFNGVYDNNIQPDKIKWNKLSKNKSPRQLCNVWKSSKEFKKIVLNKNIAKIATEITGWKGVKICQDSLFWVPSNSGGVGMHQDNSYQDWHSPGKTITCWIALTNLDKNCSGLQYLTGSHLTKTSNPIKNFFSGKNFKQTVKTPNFKKFKFYEITGNSGLIAFHHGNIWHGSNVNYAKIPRLALSIHMIPSDSKFRKKINHPQFSRYKLNNTNEMNNSFFPTVYEKKEMHNSQDYIEQRRLNLTPQENWEVVNNFLSTKVLSLKNKKIKKILLINPPQIQTQTLDLETFKNKRYFNYPPYGIGLLKSCINKKNPEIDVDIVDLNYEVLKFVDIFIKSKQKNKNLSKQEILNIKNYNFVNYFDQMFEGDVYKLEGFDVEKIMKPIFKDILSNYSPDMVGISCMFTMSHKRMLSMAKITKEFNSDIIVFAGGVHPTSSSENILRESSNIDFISLFEADESIPQLISFLNKNNSKLESLRQTAIFYNNKYYETQNRIHPAGEILELRPDYGSLNISDYSDLGEIGAYRFWWRENTKASTILSNRGCRARCSFCSVRNFNGKGVRGRSYNSVVDEMQYNKEYFGINHFMWLDDDLLFNRERTISLFNEIVKRNLNITWDASNGIIASALKDEVLDAAAASGCIGMHFGIESGNDEILKQVHKPSGKKHYLALEEKLKKYPQIFTKGFLMVGFPNETLAQMLETVEMAVKINLDWYTIQVVHPLPKTEMHQQLVEMGLLSDDEIEDEKLNYGNRSGKRKVIESSNEETNFSNPFHGDLKKIPSKEEMEDIWFTSDFKINYERINNIYDSEKLKKLRIFLKFISKKISVKNPLVDYYLKLVDNRIANNDNKILMQNENQSLFWQKRLNILMKDTYNLL